MPRSRRRTLFPPLQPLPPGTFPRRHLNESQPAMGGCQVRHDEAQRRQAGQRQRNAVKELPARKLGVPPDRTGAGGMVNTEVLDHSHRDFPRLVPPRSDPVLGRHLPRGGLFLFADPYGFPPMRLFCAVVNVPGDTSADGTPSLPTPGPVSDCRERAVSSRWLALTSRLTTG